MTQLRHNEVRTPRSGADAVLVAPQRFRAEDAVTSSRRSYAIWGVVGFLLGAVFWHVIGFWDFLGGIVYKRQQEATIIERVLTMNFVEAEEDRPLAERERAARESAQNCTTLVFDRLSGATISRPCIVIIRNVGDDADGHGQAPVLQTSARLDFAPAGR